MDLPVDGVTRKENPSLKLSFAYKFMKIDALHKKFEANIFNLSNNDYVGLTLLDIARKLNSVFVAFICYQIYNN